MERIWLSSPDMTEAERSMLLAAFDSGWVAPVGPDLSAFEEEMCDFLGLPRGCAAALSSGTAALHLGLLLAGVPAGEEVWTSTLTFTATVNAITYGGAEPVLIDVDRDTWQLSPELLEAELERAARRGRLPAAVVPVDLYGQTCDYDRILAACDRHGVPVVADAAEALGATYGGQRAGTFGRCAALSFNGNKLITTSGGGMLVSHDPELVARARHLATQAREPALHYEHVDLGFNYRMSNLLAALGRAQLGRIEQLLARRAAVNARYVEGLADVEGLSFMPVAVYGTPNRWLTCVLLDPDAIPVRPPAVCHALAEQEIEARPLWKPMHLQPVHAGRRAVGGAVAADLFARGLCLPSGSVLSDDDVDRVIAALRAVLQP